MKKVADRGLPSEIDQVKYTGLVDDRLRLDATSGVLRTCTPRALGSLLLASRSAVSSIAAAARTAAGCFN
jgi:hypothetical protein